MFKIALGVFIFGLVITIATIAWQVRDYDLKYRDWVKEFVGQDSTVISISRERVTHILWEDSNGDKHISIVIDGEDYELEVKN